MEELRIIAEFPKGGAIAKRKNGEKVFVRNYFSNKLKNIFCDEKDIETNERGLNVSIWRSTKPLDFYQINKKEIKNFIEIQTNFMSKDTRYKKNLIREFLLDLPLDYKREDIEECLPENTSLYKREDGWVLREVMIDIGTKEENHLLKEFHKIELLAKENFMNFGIYFSTELENAIKENNLKGFVDIKREIVESYIRDRNSLKKDLLKKIKESQNVNFVSSFIL